MQVSDMKTGTRVIAARTIDPGSANIQPGEAGEVFEPANAYGDGNGPMVRWPRNRSCNVYEGDVTVQELTP